MPRSRRRSTRCPPAGPGVAPDSPTRRQPADDQLVVRQPVTRSSGPGGMSMPGSRPSRWWRFARRVDCGSCGPTVAAVPWARHASAFTRAFEDVVVHDCDRGEPASGRGPLRDLVASGNNMRVRSRTRSLGQATCSTARCGGDDEVIGEEGPPLPDRGAVISFSGSSHPGAKGLDLSGPSTSSPTPRSTRSPDWSRDRRCRATLSSDVVAERARMRRESRHVPRDDLDHRLPSTRSAAKSGTSSAATSAPTPPRRSRACGSARRNW